MISIGRVLWFGYLHCRWIVIRANVNQPPTIHHPTRPLTSSLPVLFPFSSSTHTTTATTTNWTTLRFASSHRRTFFFVLSSLQFVYLMYEKISCVKVHCFFFSGHHSVCLLLSLRRISLEFIQKTILRSDFFFSFPFALILRGFGFSIPLVLIPKISIPIIIRSLSFNVVTTNLSPRPSWPTLPTFYRDSILNKSAWKEPKEKDLPSFHVYYSMDEYFHRFTKEQKKKQRWKTTTTSL